MFAVEEHFHSSPLGIEVEAAVFCIYHSLSFQQQNNSSNNNDNNDNNKKCSNKSAQHVPLTSLLLTMHTHVCASERCRTL
eukprot:4326998-Amphidinium_carterae.1